MWTADSLGRTLMPGKIEGKRKRDWQRMRWSDSLTDSMGKSKQTSGDTGEQRALACCIPWSHRVGHDLTSKQQQQCSTYAIWYFHTSTWFIVISKELHPHTIPLRSSSGKVGVMTVSITKVAVASEMVPDHGEPSVTLAGWIGAEWPSRVNSQGLEMRKKGKDSKMWWQQKSQESLQSPSGNRAAPGLEASYSCQVGKPHISNVQSRRRQEPNWSFTNYCLKTEGSMSLTFALILLSQKVPGMGYGGQVNATTDVCHT